jgi:hypothetical protein
VRSVAVFIAKCVVFSIIFWSLWYVAFRPGGAAGSSSSQQNENDALMRKYWEQAAQADQLQRAYLDQQRLAATQLEKQGELLSRWEKVIQTWEKTPRR